jgi:hypothetical protein
MLDLVLIFLFLMNVIIGMVTHPTKLFSVVGWGVCLLIQLEVIILQARVEHLTLIQHIVKLFS